MNLQYFTSQNKICMVLHKNCQVIVGKGVNNNKKFLKKLSKICKSSTIINKIISVASTEQLLSLVEISLNILKNRIPSIPRPLLKRLSAQAALIRKLSKARTAEQARLLLLHKQSNQKGRGLPAIAGLLASAVLPLLIEKYSQKNLINK